MPTGGTYGLLDRPGSMGHIQMFTSPESALAKFLYPYAWNDVVAIFDDFTGPALNTHLWTAASTNGTAFDPPATQLANGVCQGITGNVAGDEATLRSDIVWLGDNNCGMQLRWKVDNNTSTQFEVGFTDALSAATASAVDDIDTPTVTNGFADGALVAQDTGQTLTTMAFITDGSTTNMNVTKTNLGTRTPTNATYLSARVQLVQTASAVAAAYAALYNDVDAITETAQHGDVLASQIKGDVLLQAWMYWEPLTTASRTIDIDYISIWQDRKR